MVLLSKLVEKSEGVVGKLYMFTLCCSLIQKLNEDLFFLEGSIVDGDEDFETRQRVLQIAPDGVHVVRKNSNHVIVKSADALDDKVVTSGMEGVELNISFSNEFFAYSYFILRHKKSSMSLMLDNLEDSLSISAFYVISDILLEG